MPVLGLGPEGAVDADPVGIAAGEQGRARGRTDRLGDMEIGEPPPFAGEPVEVRRLETLGAEAADVAISLIVREDDDDIGRPVRGGKRGRRPRKGP